MAEIAYLYGNAITKAFNKEINLSSDAFKVMLTTSAYVPDQDNHIYKSSVTNEVTGTGYTAGGATLTTVAVTYTAATNVYKFTADPVTWANSTLTARYAVIYDNTPSTDATRPLLVYVDFGVDKVSSGGSFTITWNASGIFTVTVA